MTFNENKELFNYIYTNNQWGEPNGKNKYYSGYGSHKKDCVNKYIGYINKFIRNNNICTLLDFGCGDFNIGKKYKVNMYYGVDIVEDLIKYNKEKYEDKTHHFILNEDNQFDNIPNVDLIIIKEVLQHLTNDLIKNIIDKLLTKCKYLIIIDSIINNAKYINKEHYEHDYLYLVASKPISINSNNMFNEEPFNYDCKLIHKIYKNMQYNEYWFFWLFKNC